MSADFFYEQGVKTKQIPSTQVFGLSETGATQLYDLGSKIFDPVKGTVYTYCVSAGAIAANDVVAIADPNSFVVFTQPASAVGVALRCGVAPKAFSGAGQYGWIATQGLVVVKTSTVGVNVGDIVTPDVATAGSVIVQAVANPPTQADVIASNSILGVALSTDAAGLITIYIR